MRHVLASLILFASTSFSQADQLKLLPSEVPLRGASSSQRLLALAERNTQIVGQRTEGVKWSSSNPQVAIVSDKGVVTAVGDGRATITAQHPEAGTTTASVIVSQSQGPLPISYRHHVTAVLTRYGCNSGACHGALAGKGGLKLSLRGYDPEADHFALTRQVNGRRVDRTQPADSLLLKKAIRTLPHGGGKRLDEESEDYALLLNWVRAGATGLPSQDIELTRLEVFPPAAILHKDEPLNVIVRAWYSDGHAEDVTRWARFGSSEEQVAVVDEDGQVQVRGSGEAAIHVGFQTLVATMNVRVPYPNNVPVRVYESAARHNFIDDHILVKLRQLNIEPAPLCSDAEFIRRAYLDAAGILPTPEETKAFLADPRADKRTRLVNALLDRSEFTDYWAYRWSDLLLVSSRKISQPAMWAFYRAIRQAVADNRPFDQFARDILTARGSTLQNGLGNYYVLHKDIADLTESTAVTFLGMSITCARCHNHPLEKWTQDQYWALANLFSRVHIKNGDRNGEQVVSVANSGEAQHLRRGVPMPPTPLDGLPMSFDSPRDRREYFAEWLTKPDNPYFAKAIVNRVWRNFMGRGLVEAEDDLRATNPPTNAELFDALTADFIARKYDVKHLIRSIMLSAAYQRSSTPTAGNVNDDRFYSRYLVKRLSAEVILDAYSQVTGVPTPFVELSNGPSNGISKTTNYPLGTRALQLPDAMIISRFLESFGRPERAVTCACERQQDASVGQALHLNNGKTLNDKLRDPGSRLSTWLKENLSDREAVNRVFLLALSREPTAAEQQRMTAALAESDPANRREALEDLFWAVLTSREFLFNR